MTVRLKVGDKVEFKYASPIVRIVTGIANPCGFHLGGVCASFDGANIDDGNTHYAGEVD